MLARIANAANALSSSRTIFVCNMHDKKKKSEQSCQSNHSYDHSLIISDNLKEGMRTERYLLDMLQGSKCRNIFKFSPVTNVTSQARPRARRPRPTPTGHAARTHAGDELSSLAEAQWHCLVAAACQRWLSGISRMMDSDTYGYVLVHIRHSNSESPGLSVETLPTTRHQVQDGCDAGSQGGGRVYEEGWSPLELGLDEEPTA